MQTLFATYRSTLTPYREVQEILQTYHQTFQSYSALQSCFIDEYFNIGIWGDDAWQKLLNIDSNPPLLAHLLSTYHHFKMVCLCEFGTKCEFEEEIIELDSIPQNTCPTKEKHFYLFSQGENILLSALLPSREGIPYEFVITPTMLEQYCNDKEAFLASLPCFELTSCSTQIDFSTGLSEYIVIRLFEKILKN